MTDVADPPKCRLGRPRSEAVDAAIESAVLELLVDEGYGGVTMEGVAARAGVGKASLYRRWPTKEQLVIAAVLHRCEEDRATPDTGSLRSDVVAYCTRVVAKLRRHGAILRAVNAETARHPALAESFRAAFVEQRRAEVRDVLARAVDRGELPPGADLELLGDLGPALLWHRLTVTGAPLGDDLPERIAALIAPAHR
ncbi:MAG TPA: TetR/AcrR family transcriptional regulator [Acidimicrobiales bacterium]|nr:TetR/AcrR family transcriptional regulator [Acidimicrobiales bacterium]